MSDLIGIAYVFGAMFSVYAVARAGKFDPCDNLLIQIVTAFVFWPLVLPLAVAASVGRNAKRQDRATGLGPKGEHAVPEGQTPKVQRHD